jgi:hypothetical protein
LSLLNPATLKLCKLQQEMTRIKINTTFEEDEEERRQFFCGVIVFGEVAVSFQVADDVQLP